MNRVKNKKTISLLAAALMALPFGMNAQNGEATFKQTCAACHSIGKGKLVGPDLKDVQTRRKEEWIIKFVKGSQALVKSGDPDAVAIFNEFNMVMPDQNLQDADIKALIAYIAEQSGAAGAPVAATAPAADTTPVKISPELIAKGKEYFDGTRSFANGGASCISCHNVNYTNLLTGGVLAKDLTQAYSRLGGDAGLNGILTAPPFPAMTAAFKNNPLTADEVAAISAFLKDADKQNLPAQGDYDPLLIGGFAAFFVVFCAILILWNKRKNKTVKKEIYDRQITSIN